MYTLSQFRKFISEKQILDKKLIASSKSENLTKELWEYTYAVKTSSVTKRIYLYMARANSARISDGKLFESGRAGFDKEAFLGLMA